MITNDELTDAFTEVLNAAGAKVCEACGSRALVCLETADRIELDASEGDDKGEHADRGKWFCFACGR